MHRNRSAHTTCGYAIYFQGIQTPRSQFKKRDKFELTRIFPINTECKNCRQQASKNYTTFCPHALRAKADGCLENEDLRPRKQRPRKRRLKKSAGRGRGVLNRSVRNAPSPNKTKIAYSQQISV